MRLTNVRQFIRGGYLTATEPVQVIRGTEVLGIWTPVISPPVVVPELAATPERLTGNGSVAGITKEERAYIADPLLTDAERFAAVVSPSVFVKPPEFRPYSKSRQAKGK